MNHLYRLKEVAGDAGALERFHSFLSADDLVVGGTVDPVWHADGSGFWFYSGPRQRSVLCTVDGSTGAVLPVLDAEKTRHALSRLLGCRLPSERLPFDTAAVLENGLIELTFEGRVFLLSPDSYSIDSIGNGLERDRSHRDRRVAEIVAFSPRHAPRPYQRAMWQTDSVLTGEARSPDGDWFASTRDGNIILRASADDHELMLTTDGTASLAWDVEAPRFKLNAGMKTGRTDLDPWSPDSQRLFAIKFDRSRVPDLPFVRYLDRQDRLAVRKLQRAGGPVDVAYPHVIDVARKSIVTLDLGETEDYYFTLIGWMPDGSEVLFSRHSRNFRRVDLLAGDASGRAVRTLFSETANTFVSLQHDVLFGGDNHVWILGDGSGVIWRSARSGWNHLYLYAMDGTLVRALTQGGFAVIDVVAVDLEDGWVYFTAHHDTKRPYDTHLCRVELQGGQIKRLTSMDGQNVVSMSPSKKRMVVVNSRHDRAFRADFHSSDGTHLGLIQRADTSGLDAIGGGAPEEFSVRAADDETLLWGVMYKPADFEPGRKYPLIDHIYAGPQVSMVTRDFSLGGDTMKRLDRALAQLGYIVISVDARGTPERSRAFQDVVHGNWGRNEVADHVAAIAELARRHSYIDSTRVGVWGHSWGGYFTIRAMAQAADVFKVGVASAPGCAVHDSILYEPYLGLPERQHEAYEYADNCRWVHKITGELMMVVGTADPCVYLHTMELTRRLIVSGIDHELVVLPDARHGFQGADDEYFVSKLVSHFEKHLHASQPCHGVPINARQRAFR